MKNMRKVLAMVLAVMMVMSLATTAFADEATYTLTLNKALEGHTYTAYQIFAGDLSGNVLSNIVWGSGVSAEGQEELGDAASIAATLTTTAQAEAFAAEVAPYLDTAAGSATVAEGATSCQISGLEAGYYLVETSATPDKDGVKTYYVMVVVKDTEANIKADAPEVEKTFDKNDVSIGDTVTFTLTATMPTNIQGYETYQVVFHDTLSAGLDFTEGTVKVTVDGADKTSAFTINESNGTLTVSCADVLAQGATASSKIVVTYNAVLDSDAVIGADGNPNTVYLEYSNDPNWNGEGDEPTGNTPEADVEVYTWEIPVFKYTGTDTPLAGAGFTLYTDEACTQAVTVTKDSTVTDKNVYKVDPASETAEIVTDATGRFEIEGLAQGTYYLKETTTPAGYNTADVVTVVIGANGALTQDGDATNEVAIVNYSGTTLPETGGMGTTMFYVFGGLMVMAAVVLLVTKKRMANVE